MNTLNIKPEMTIDELGEVVSGYLNDHWKEVLSENSEELKRLFPEYEDATYGMYLDKLIPPVWKQMEQSGYRSAFKPNEEDFVIAGCLNFSNSLEKAHWGTPNHEMRVFWIVIENQLSHKIGTLLFEISHSHVQFDLPAPPKLTTYEGTVPQEITAKIVRLKENS